MSKATLHDYQKYCVDFILDHQSSLLLLDMGLGKTLSTLTALSTLKDFGLLEKVLVIAPLAVAKYTWGSEIEKWGFDLRYSKVLGDKQSRIKALAEEVDIYLINRENVPWLVEFYGKKWPFKILVIDELSSFKNNQSKRFKALRKVIGKVKKFIGLTGTPAPNNLMDLWSQVYLADQGERLGRTITSYRSNYFYPTLTNGHIVYKYGLKDGAEDAIYQKIEDIAISMKSKDVLKLPKRTDNIISVEMSQKEQRIYKRMKKDLILEVGEEEIVAVNSAVLSGKLLQMASGAVYSTDKKIIEIHDKKLKALEQIIEEAQGEPVLVFYQYQHDLKRIKAKFPEAQEFEGNIDKWNKGEIPLLLVHPQSAGHGLNLQEGGHIAVWYSLTWSLEFYQQANARLDRQGQEKPVIIHHLVTKGTIDEQVIQALQNKEVGQDALIEAVKANLKGG